jgi:hypothetical protein
VKLPIRARLLWRPSERWITWGTTTVACAGSSGVRASREYMVSIGPVFLGVLLPLSRAKRAEQERRLIPALRRVEKHWRERRWTRV